MKRILITGATGNTGKEVINYLYKIRSKNKVVAGVRNVEWARSEFSFAELDFVHFDIENPETFNASLHNIDSIFLMRPPHISNIEKYFKPLVQKLKEKQIKEVVFLSVQGAERSKIIPHNKIERLIETFQLDYIFLRPGYFMQNLTTILLQDIRKKQKIVLPAGNAKFNWIDVANIGETAAILLDNFQEYKNRKIDLTGYENLNFNQVTEIINTTISTHIAFKNVSPYNFYRIKKNEGIERGLINVMLLLHFLPRFQKEPEISTFYEQLTGKKPTTLREFIEREKDVFQ